MKNNKFKKKKKKEPEYTYGLTEYDKAMSAFDAALCEALAVGQASAGRYATPHHGYATHIFTSLCTQAVSMIRAAPRTRWTTSDFEHWSFNCVAGQFRAIMEGEILFTYIIEAPASPEQWSAKLNVMHLNDCTRRIKLFKNIPGQEASVADFELAAEELRDRLRSNAYFMALPPNTNKRCLSGDFLMISSRDEMLESMGKDRAAFNVMFDLLSQHTHILPLSFYRIEPQGRGTGLENEADRNYIGAGLTMCAEILKTATDKIVEAFPDVAPVRQGRQSKFSPGPAENVRPPK